MKRVTKTMRDAGLLMIAVAALLPLLLFAVDADAMIDGVGGTSFAFTAKADHISTPDGGSVLFWGYANGNSRAQYPGPTLIVNQGDTVTITLKNKLNMPVSIVFPGQEGVTAVGGTTGLLTQESSGINPTDTVTYTFTATRAGTYLYHSGTRPELQVEMGLIGAIIVRPYAGADQAYNDPATQFDHEYLFLLSEMDPRIHDLVEFQGVAALESTDYLSDYFPNYWFINGRNAPDTMFAPYAKWLPTQPYNCMPMTHPGDRMLMRVIGAGRDLHPFHHHGNHARVIARDGRLLESDPGVSGPDLSYEVFTIQSVPGKTVDAIFQWTGKGMGWDIYGHQEDIDNEPTGNFPGPEDIDHNGNGVFDPLPDLEPNEYAPDHGKPFPVNLPGDQELTFGGFWSGSPFLGSSEPLPPGEGGLNPNAGFAFMWHSHTEKEMTNYNIFPGGMMTMMIIDPPGTIVP